MKIKSGTIPNHAAALAVSRRENARPTLSRSTEERAWRKLLRWLGLPAKNGAR